MVGTGLLLRVCVLGGRRFSEGTSSDKRNAEDTYGAAQPDGRVQRVGEGEDGHQQARHLEPFPPQARKVGLQACLEMY